MWAVTGDGPDHDRTVSTDRWEPGFDVALEQLLYVGTDTDYMTAIENRGKETIAVHSVETVEDVTTAGSVDAAVVDEATVDEPVRAVRILTDRWDATPVLAVVDSTTAPPVVDDLLAAGAHDYVERDAHSGRPGQLLARLEAVSARGTDEMERRFRREFEARRRTERRLTTVLDRIPQPVFYRDADGIYLGCNNAFERLCGQSREEILGYGTEQLQNDELAAICERHDEEVRRTGEKQTLETTVTVQGEKRHLRIHKAPLTDERAELDGVVGSVEEITEQRRQQETLREQRENLEILNSVTRHDIRNDLQVVLGMADVLRDHVDDEGMEYLETVVTKGHHAVDITRQARDLTETMLDSDAGTDRISLNSTLETQIDEIRSTYDQAIVTIEGTIPTVAVSADGMLSSVFRNILANGIQHNDSPVPRLRIWVRTAEDRVTVHITDNGPGVPDERKDEIFGRGEKGLESSGTGLGLYLVDTLIDRYGGDVSVTDGEDGAEFVVTLQRAEG